MNSNIEILEHLSYINECVLIEATGEAKSELDRLVERLKANASIVNDLPDYFSELLEAQSFFNKDNYSNAATRLSTATRKAWNIELENKEKGHSNNMKINSKQRLVLLIAAFAVCAMFIYPPFSMPRLNLNPGYSFIWLPPITDSDGNSASFVNSGLLLTQCLGVVLVAFFAFIFFKDNE